MATDPMPTEPAVLVIPPDQGRTLAAYGSTGQFKLQGSDTSGRLCLALAATPPGAGPPPHINWRDDELFVVLEGELSFMTGTKWTRVTPGTVVYIPRGAPHTFRNTGTTLSRHWVLTTPSGFEDFYARSAELFAGGRIPEPQELRALAAEYGYEMLAPGPAQSGAGVGPVESPA